MCRRVWILALGFGLAGVGAAGSRADLTAIVNANRVNVRGGPSLSTEVVTQVHKGESVTVLDSREVHRAHGDEVARWYKIRLPEDTPVWVHAGFLDATTKVVTVARLNVRAGPGENYSIVGRLTKGEVVREIRVVDNWMEIEPPPGTYGYVAATFVSAPTAVAPVVPATEGGAPSLAATPPPAAVPADQRREPPGVPSGDPAPPKPGPRATGPADSGAAAPAPVTPAPGPPPPPVVADGRTTASASAAPALPKAAALPRRIIRREGVVCYTVSIQAPTIFKLKSTDTRRDLNFLLPGSPEIRLASFKGQRVVVTGEEQIEPRWPALPMIEVRKIELAP